LQRYAKTAQALHQIKELAGDTGPSSIKLQVRYSQWRTQEFFSGGSTNSVEDRENGDLGAVDP